MTDYQSDKQQSCSSPSLMLLAPTKTRMDNHQQAAMWLDVYANNPVSLLFHEKAGFKRQITLVKKQIQ